MRYKLDVFLYSKQANFGIVQRKGMYQSLLSGVVPSLLVSASGSSRSEVPDDML